MTKANFINQCALCRKEMKDKDRQLNGIRRLKLLESIFEGEPMLKNDKNCMGAFEDTERIWEQAVVENWRPPYEPRLDS